MTPYTYRESSKEWEQSGEISCEVGRSLKDDYHEPHDNLLLFDPDSENFFTPFSLVSYTSP